MQNELRNYDWIYCKVASDRLSWLSSSTFKDFKTVSEFDAYVVWPLAKKSWKLNSRLVYCSQLYGKLFLETKQGK